MARAARIAVTGALLCGGLGACVSPAPAVRPAAASEMPRLEVRIDCGGCEVRAEVPRLIRDGYVSALARAGARETDGRMAVLTIRAYTERGFGTRFLAGPLGVFFRDAVDAELVVDGRTARVSESTRVPFQGIDAVARRIGEQALDLMHR